MVKLGGGARAVYGHCCARLWLSELVEKAGSDCLGPSEESLDADQLLALSRRRQIGREGAPLDQIDVIAEVT